METMLHPACGLSVFCGKLNLCTIGIYSVVSVKLPKDLVAQFKEKCKVEGVSQAQIVKKAIEEFLGE